MEALPKLFGSPGRAAVLVGLALLRETYARELARALELPLLSVQRALRDYEAEGVAVSRFVGKNRIYSLNPRWYAFAELRTLLFKYAASTDVEERLASLRRRPGTRATIEADDR